MRKAIRLRSNYARSAANASRRSIGNATSAPPGPSQPPLPPSPAPAVAALVATVETASDASILDVDEESERFSPSSAANPEQASRVPGMRSLVDHLALPSTLLLLTHEPFQIQSRPRTL